MINGIVEKKESSVTWGEVHIVTINALTALS